jgi:hypothetical protein
MDFTGEKAQAHRCYVTCSRFHTEEVVELGFEPTSATPQDPCSL